MHKTIKLALCFTISSFALAVGQAARADSSYQPYYYDRENVQFAHTSPVVSVDEGSALVMQPTAAQSANATAPTPRWQSPQTLSLQLGTKSGLDGGVQASYYHYNEPSGDVKLTGPQLGVVAAATTVFGNHMFDTLDARYAYGRVDYSSIDGTSKDHANSLWEVRDVIGHDFIWNNSDALSPYFGIGFRDLYNDDRGLTTLGFQGYQRESEYLYIPLGVKSEMRIDSTDLLHVDFEYDYFAHGWQTSHLGDAGFGDPTVHNDQDSGLGFRGDVMWETGSWAVGPFINYWNISDSASKIFTSPDATCHSTTCVGTEPHNMTVEAGLQLKYHFFSF